jgi:iron complex transport system substrate-binding protein
VRRAFALLLLLALAIAPARATERVVSLNLCTDQLAVLLAPEKIAALSQLSRDPTLSFVAPEAATIPQVRASAEAVLALHPDLVLAARFGAQTTLSLLERRAIRVERFDLPSDFPGIARLTRDVAAALGVPGRAEPLIATMDATLAAAGKPPATRSAIAWEPRGYTAGPDSLMGAVLRAAGLTNAATGDRIGIETLLRHKPDLLILPETPAFPSLATEMLRTPALASIAQRAIPPALTLCAGPFTAKAVALLAPGGAP